MKSDYFWGIVFVIFCSTTWVKPNDATLSWAVVLVIYAILRSFFPIYMMFKYPKESAWKYLSAVCLLGVSSGISDAYCIDKYDNIILFLIIVLSLMTFVNLIRGFRERVHK